MFLNFEKWQACQNDFIVTWIFDSEADILLNSLKNQAPCLCSKKGEGIGADGILMLQRQNKNEILPHSLTIINQDGTVAKNCGNGLRCATLSVYKKFSESGNRFEKLDFVEFNVQGETKICALFPTKKSGFPYVRVEMGKPLVKIWQDWPKELKEKVNGLFRMVALPELKQTVYTVNIGNDHLVIFVENISSELLEKVGSAAHREIGLGDFNIHLAAPMEIGQDRHNERSMTPTEIERDLGEVYLAFSYERGVGQTMACGSGASAIGAIILKNGEVSRKDWLGIDMPGGRLYVKQESEEARISLAGPAEFVFAGTIEI